MSDMYGEICFSLKNISKWAKHVFAIKLKRKTVYEVASDWLSGKK